MYYNLLRQNIFSKALLISLLAVGLFLTGCDESGNSNSDRPVSDSPAPTEQAGEMPAEFDEVPDHATDAELIQLRAKFIEFELGDASHFIFEDEAGEMWDFGGCEAANCDFAEEVPLEQADESNQGWGSNAELQGKWFDLGYYEEERELYIDGPMGTVQVIAEVRGVE